LGLTAVEKILAAHTGAEARAGDFVVANVDLVMGTDGNAPLVIQLLRDELGMPADFDASHVVLVVDHTAPAPTDGAANMQKSMREFAAATGARLYDAGEGISHVLLPEQGHALPGRLVVGSDSHTVTYGALNCLGIGMGATDVAVAVWAKKAWMRVPETVRVEVEGELRPGVTGKDAALEMVRLVGVDGATYRCLEIDGELDSLSVSDRFTLCNMSIEVGAKCSMMPVDEHVREYLEGRAEHVPEPVWSDPDAQYARTVTLDLGAVEQLVAAPHDLTNVVRASEVEGEPVDLAFIGTCTNGRIGDLRAAAAVLRDQKVHPRVRLVVTPGSRETYLEALRDGLIDVFVESGAMVTPPGCGPCVGAHMGVPADGDRVISTGNRNFQGRMGNRRSEIYVASPETVAASAVLGQIATATAVSV
jgi:3-isopropylmalate/(R)-2-methylmalate dehydratase large subunit